jgi:RecA/RadA recombinase
MQWIKDPGVREQFITWLYGPAGSGKTAIAQSIAEACEEEGLLAASFFFGRLANGRNTLAHFVATLAYQLSRSIPEMGDPLLMAIEKDPSIFSRSLPTQMRVLIIEPLKSVPFNSLARLVVVDGVDECGPNDKAHAELLKVLGAAMSELRNFSIIFLIGSRPEYEIRTAFNKTPLSSLTKSLVLDDKYTPDKDIKIYF